MNKRIKDNTSLLSKIIWHDINKKGYINKSLKYQAAVYIYMRIPYFNSKACYYVGSTVKLTSRISLHKCRIINWNKYKKTGSPIFYRNILKYGWLNFKFVILEYIDLFNITNIEQKKKIILEREQYYLDKINPSLNICKMADSPLGIKRNTMFSINLSKSQIGKSKKLNIDINNISKIVTSETKLKISLRCKGVTVKVFDKSNNIVNLFTTITSTAKCFGVDTKTISKIFKTIYDYIKSGQVNYIKINFIFTILVIKTILIKIRIISL